MTKYKYSGYDAKTGKPTSGEIEADSVSEARRLVIQMKVVDAKVWEMPR